MEYWEKALKQRNETISVNRYFIRVGSNLIDTNKNTELFLDNKSRLCISPGHSAISNSVPHGFIAGLVSFSQLGNPFVAVILA
jgi:hypothetical protein